MNEHDTSGKDKRHTSPSSSQAPHRPGETEGNRKGLDDANASQNKRSDKGTGASQGENPEKSGRTGSDMPTPVFDEGGLQPSPIQSTTNDNVRTPVPTTPADPKGQPAGDTDQHTEATMPPGQGRDEKRNTM